MAQVLNAVRHAWNVERLLLNAEASLVAPPEWRVVWEPAEMPGPPEPPVGMAELLPGGAAAPGGKDAMGAKGGKDAKDAKGAKDPKAGAKDAKGAKGKKGTAAVPEEAEPWVWPPIWVSTLHGCPRAWASRSG